MNRLCKAPILTALVITCLALDSKAQIVLNFDDLAPSTTVTNQYTAQGIEFGVTPFGSQGLGVKIVDLDNPNFKAAHSGSQVADISRTAEVSQTDIWGHFDVLRRTLSVLVGSYYLGDHDVKLIIYDVSGNQIGQDEHTVPGHSGANTTLSVNAGTAKIAYFEIVASPDDHHLLFIDDLTFDVATGAPQPDFAINLLSLNGVWVSPPGSTVANLVLHRVNGSSGRISFSVAGLPQGIAPTFAPNPSAGGEGSSVNLSLTAAPGTVSSQYTVTVTATPLMASAGTTPHSIQFQLLVAPSQVMTLPLTVTDLSPDSQFGDTGGGASPTGRIMGLAIDPTNDSIIYAASENAGIWKSVDAAQHWKQSSFGLRTGVTQNQLSLAVDPNDPRRLLYATQDDDGRPSGTRLGGLWVSIDAAASWQHVDLSNCPQPTVNSVTFSSGQPFAATGCGVFTSTDPNLASPTWQLLTNYFLPYPAATHVIGAGSQTLFACESHFIYRSTTLGVATATQPAWSLMNLGDGNDCKALAVAPLGGELQPSTVVVSHATNVGAGREITLVNFTTRSTQDLNFSNYANPGGGGSHFESVFTILRKSAPPGEARPGYRYDIYASEGFNFFIFDPEKLQWDQLQNLHVDTWSMAFPANYDPPNGSCVAYAANDGGVYQHLSLAFINVCDPHLTIASGWVRAQSGLHALSSGTMAGVSQSFGSALYLPTADNDVWATVDGGRTWQPFADNLGDAGQTFIDPALMNHEVSTRNGGGCIALSDTNLTLSISKGSSPPTTTPNNIMIGPMCISEANMYSGLEQPPNMPAFSQIMALASETPAP